MKITSFSKTTINKNNSNKPAFAGMIPQKYILELTRQNTPEAKKILESVLAYNATLRGAQNVNPDKIARELANRYNIKTEFGNNPFFASCVGLTVNIFRRLGFPLPPEVLLKDLSGLYQNYIGLCAVQSYDREIFMKFKKDFPIGTVMMNSCKNWGGSNSGMNIQEELIELFKQNRTPNCHFLSPFIHEFFHCAHIKNLQKRFHNSGSVMRKLQRDFRNKDTISFITKENGKYASTKPCELFAEEMTELVITSMHPKTLLPNEMTFKMARAKEPFLMDKLIDACWNGDIKQVEKLRKKENILDIVLKKLKKD